jgi:hypothetical protein
MRAIVALHRLALSVFMLAPVHATYGSIIDPNGLTLVATVHTRGQYDNAQLGTWNGQPLSPTNQPTFDEDQLSADWSFYVDPASTNTLYILASNVLDTQYGFIFGSPFDLVALTGFEFSLPISHFSGNSSVAFSNQFAVAGEELLGPISGQSATLTSTPGWSLTGVSGPINQPSFDISTSSVDDAFTHFSSVFGETRIFGGGVFQFSFDPSVNLFENTDFDTLTASASNGLGAYIEDGTLTFPTIPEPGSGIIVLTSLLALALALRRPTEA